MIFKPLSDFIQQSEIDFSQPYTPMRKYNSGNNTEYYYLLNSNKSKAYGWVHNLNHYWFNNFYYYYADANNNYERLDSCSFPLVYYGDLLDGFDANKTYNISFYPTRMGANIVVPNSRALYNYNGRLYIPAAVFDNTPFGCDTSNADFAFIITDGSNSRVSHTPTSDNKTNFDAIISPNPSDGIYSISINEAGSYHLMIFNSIGKLVLSINNINQKYTLDLNNQPAGIFFLSISKDNDVKHLKLIKR